MKAPILITGGTGYIGSHIVHMLRDHEHSIVVVDNLSNSENRLPIDVPFYQVDIADTTAIKKIISNHGITSVIHLAAFLSVEESVSQPLKYYQNNVGGTANLLQACVETGIEKFIFSSTGATYASSEEPLHETESKSEPTSPYGMSKLMAERVIRDTVAVTPLKAVILRYFNVVGADPKGRTGQQGTKATHLISRACQAAAGDNAQMHIFGEDYATPDGTALRDYIHVSDLAEAHRVALEQNFTEDCKTFNCGYGTGFSVKQVVERVKAITGKDFPVTLSPRRPGDLAQTIANNNALLTETSWQPQYNDLDVIITTAWNWYQRERENR